MNQPTAIALPRTSVNRNVRGNGSSIGIDVVSSGGGLRICEG